MISYNEIIEILNSAEKQISDCLAYLRDNKNTIIFKNNLSCEIGPKYKHNLMEVFKDGNFSNNMDSINNGE